MDYLKNIQVAKKYGIHPTTVAGYIKRALASKNELKLVEVKGRHYILDTEDNHFQIQKLLDKTLSYKSSQERVVLQVSDELYNILSPDQVLNLYNDLKTQNRIPMRLHYLGKGGQYWVDMYKQAEKDNSYVLNNPQKEILSVLIPYIKPVLADYKTINIYDIGASNQDQLSPVFESLVGKNINYIPLDISKTILENTVLEMQNFVPKDQIFPHILDFEITSLRDILYKFKAENDDSINLVLFLGGTIDNFEPKQQIRILRNINDGMLEDDLLFVVEAKDTPDLRYKSNIKNNILQIRLLTHIPKILGITEDLYDNEFTFNHSTEQKEFNLILKVDIEINFEKINKQITFRSGQKINVYTLNLENFVKIINKTEESGMITKFIFEHQSKPFIGHLSSNTKTRI